MIRYIDSAGWAWEVCEVVAPAAPPVRADAPPPADEDGALGSLYFFSRLGTRRLSAYPDSWSHLTKPDLERLCHEAQEIN